MIIEKVLNNIRIVIIANSDNHATKIIYDNNNANDKYPILDTSDINVYVTGGEISKKPIIAHMENLCKHGYSEISKDFYETNYERMV